MHICPKIFVHASTSLSVEAKMPSKATAAMPPGSNCRFSCNLRLSLTIRSILEGSRNLAPGLTAEPKTRHTHGPHWWGYVVQYPVLVGTAYKVGYLIYTPGGSGSTRFRHSIAPPVPPGAPASANTAYRLPLTAYLRYLHCSPFPLAHPLKSRIK